MSDSVNENSAYFLSHILPWVLLALSVVTISILVYHCKKSGKCIPKDKDKNYLLHDTT